MNSQKRALFWINALGGAAVLGSYAHGFWTHPSTRNDLWGGVPAQTRPVYVVSMFAAAAGYLAFTGFLYFHPEPESGWNANRLRYKLFHGLYLAILAPSAIWMPLTFQMLQSPDPTVWKWIQGVLAAVALGSTGMVAALLRFRPPKPTWSYGVAVAGSLLFLFHTAILDALVWTALFPYAQTQRAIELLP